MTEEVKQDLVTEIMGEEHKETPPEAEVKEEAKPVEAKPEKTEAKEPEKKVVDHGAFHEERERRKELQRRLDEEAAERKKLEERFTKILETVAPREEEYTDPLAALEKKITDMDRTLNKSAAQIEQDRKQWESEQQLVSKYQASIAAYSKDVPDFMDARTHLINDKVKELKALDFTDAEIEKEIRVIEKNIVERAYKQEKSPAEVIHKLALEKGYKKAAAEAPKKTIEQVEKTIEASKSLSPGGQPESGAGIEKLSMREISEMSDEEFEREWKELEKRAKRRA